MLKNNWQHHSLLDTDQLDETDIKTILALAQKYHDFNRQTVKKSDLLKGRSIILFFAENSTRTKTSFDIAAKRLGADSFSLGVAGSSLNKGESLKDTVLTLEAMHPDLIVVRHSHGGLPSYLARNQNCSIINAGDGCHAHPTQALLDLFTLNSVWNGEFKNKTMLILGDIAHSRVARSNIPLLKKLGVNVRLCAPRTLMPPAISTWPVDTVNCLEEGLEGADAVMCLRLQLERQQNGLLPDLDEYSRRYCLTEDMLGKASPDLKILHPGPMNRGVEISGELADSAKCLALEQVEAGVAVRMALLHLLLASSQKGVL